MLLRTSFFIIFINYTLSSVISLGIKLIRHSGWIGWTFILTIVFQRDCISFISISSAMEPTPVLLPGKSHGRRSLVDSSPWGLEESDMTERLYFHFSLSCLGEGNGNPLQCSCLENPRDRGAWWAAVYGVAQSRTRLKQLSSSSNHIFNFSKIMHSSIP